MSGWRRKVFHNSDFQERILKKNHPCQSFWKFLFCVLTFLHLSKQSSSWGEQEIEMVCRGKNGHSHWGEVASCHGRHSATALGFVMPSTLLCPPSPPVIIQPLSQPRASNTISRVLFFWPTAYFRGKLYFCTCTFVLFVHWVNAISI